MGHCERCDQESPLISFPLNLCASCIRSAFDDVLPRIRAVHGRSRTSFGLPAAPPRSEHGLTCAFCTNQCRLGPEERGFCGTRQNASGRLRGGGPREGNLSWYHDPLPTNCVADWVCPGGTGCGYPEYAHSQGPEHGYKNLAVFFHSCSFDCLFCQNWHYREHSREPGRRHLDFLTDGVDERTSCICYFGGDPTPHLPYAIAASRRALEKNPGRILRICWETNGAMNPKLADRMASLSLKTGGCVKFDLKAWDDRLHQALCGVSNHWTLANFRRLARLIPERPDPPLLVASTLLVPGYVDVEEVARIARFIASVDKNIPYSLLAFHPQFLMQDLPTTSRGHAEACREAAYEAGLRRVRVGNIHLLRDSY